MTNVTASREPLRPERPGYLYAPGAGPGGRPPHQGEGARRRARQDGRAQPRSVLQGFPCVEGHRPSVPREPGDGAHRPVGLRQVHAAEKPQPHERPRGGLPRRGRDHAGRRGCVPLHRREQPAPSRRHGVSAAQPLPDERVRQRGVRPAHARHQEARGSGRHRGTEPARRRHLGRDEGSSEEERARVLRRPAAAPVHRARVRCARKCC